MPFASNAGTRINYEFVGSGPPLVLHIGFMGRLQDWGRPDVEVVQALRDEYQLILLDPRGYGASDKPHDATAYTADQIVGDVVAVLDDLGIAEAHFWGYSRGAAVGFWLGTLRPDRFQSLILGGGHPYPRDFSRMLEDAEVLRTAGIEAYVAMWEQAIGPLPAEVRTAWLANDPLALAADLAAAGARAAVDPSAIELPALLYCGDRDPPHDRASEAAHAMRRAKFVSLPGCDHATSFRRGAELIVPEVRGFLAELRLPATP
jgi:pimeloyl-ACP methyl ester carboxylesterase